MIRFRALSTAFVLIATAATGVACSDEERPTGTESPSRSLETTDHELRADLRDLWADHASWTRFYLISAMADLPDQPQAKARLVRAQVALADALVPFYGRSAADDLEGMLRNHVAGTARVAAAMRAEDQPALDLAVEAWRENADEIVDHLTDLNPDLPRQSLQRMMDDQLRRTLAQASARQEFRWADDATAFEASSARSRVLADTLAAAIADDRTDEVQESPLAANERALQLRMRDLWRDRATWSRVLTIGWLAGLTDTDVARERLLANQDDIGAAFGELYGVEAGAELADLLREDVGLFEAVIDEAGGRAAAQSPGIVAPPSARQRWHQQGAAIAHHLGDLGGGADREQLERTFSALRATAIAEVTARAQGDWGHDVMAHDAVADHSVMLADLLSERAADVRRVRGGR